MKRAAWCVLPVAALLAGCASNPEQSIYIMAAPANEQEAAQANPGSIVIKLQPVILPDFLDTTDLMTRTGRYGVQASRTGRWGERLSKGVTSTLAADLGQRLRPGIVVDGPVETASVQIDVTVSAFDVTETASVLAASWTVTWPGAGHSPMVRQGMFATGIARPGGDLAAVAAMAATVGKLSDGIAATIRG